MKINPTELQQIIKEEALRLKKRMMLEGEKKEILKKLQEMEECGMMEEDALNEISTEEVAANKLRLEKEIDDTMSGIATKYPTLQFGNNKDTVLQQAQSDNYAGHVTYQQNKQQGTANYGKVFLRYVPAPLTGFRKFAAAAGNAIRGGHNFGSGPGNE